ncbi:MAG: hypothetical protein KF773_25645 [Deltaproteobacteria bacterium]|nr:hypothetical protein [Deltaproteobacteria bacterium]MCW5807916.1 hypothetical protein [Deltaproteobacteria bacterium]
MSAEPRLKGRPDKIFVSVDESSGRSTVSFAPADSGDPISFDDDRTGDRAMAGATTIAKRFPGSTVSGPHFHTARPPGARKPRRRAAG